MGESSSSGSQKGDIIIIKNENGELIFTRIVTGLCMCIDNRKLN